MLKKYKKAPIGKRKGLPSWCIVSHRTGKVLSCYRTKREAQKALKRMARFRKKR